MNTAFRQNVAAVTAAGIVISAALYFGGVTPGFQFTSIALACVTVFAIFGWPGKRAVLTCDRRLLIGLTMCISILALGSLTSPSLRLSLEGFLYYAGLLMIFLLALYGFNRLERWHVLVWIIIGLTIVISAWGLINWLMDVNRLWGLQFSVRMQGVHGTFINRNHFAGFVSLGIPFVMIMFLHTGKLHKKILLGLAMLVMLTAILFSLSRGVWLSCAGSIFITLLMLIWFRSERKSLLQWLYLVIPFFLILVFRIGLEPLLFRIDNTLQLADQMESMGGRIGLWKTALQIFLDNPWLGTGPGNFDLLYPIHRIPGMNTRPWFVHNDYLQLLVEGGIFLVLAAAPLLWWIVRMLGQAQRESHRALKKDMYLATLGCLAAFLLQIIWDFQSHILACAAAMVVLLGAALANSSVFRKAPVIPVIFFTPVLLAGLAAGHLAYSQSLMEGAATALDEGKPDLAGRLSRHVQTIDPLNAEAYYYYGEAGLAQSRFGLAKYENMVNSFEAYLQAISILPERGLYWLRAGMLMESVWWLSRSPLGKSSLQSTIVRCGQAEASHDLPSGEFPDKIGYYYRQALRRDPRNPYFHEILARYLLRQGRTEEARQHVIETISLLPEMSEHRLLEPFFAAAEYQQLAERGLEKASENELGRSSALLQLINLNILQRDFPTAGRYLRQLEQLDERFFRGEGKRLKAILALRQQQYSEAERLFDEYIRQYRYPAETVPSIASIYQEFQETARGLAFLEKLPLAVRLKFPEYTLLKARLASQTNRNLYSIECYEEYLKSNPDNAGAILELSGLYQQAGQLLATESLIRRALKLGSTPDKPSQQLRLTDILIQQGEFEQARKELENATALYPEEPRIWLRLGELEESRRHFGPAAAAFERAAQYLPAGGEVKRRAARCYYQAGDRKKAMEIFGALLRENPADEDLRQEYSALHFD